MQLKRIGKREFLTIKPFYAAMPAALCALIITVVVLVYLVAKLGELPYLFSLQEFIKDTLHSYIYTVFIALIATLISMVFGFCIAFLVWTYRKGMVIYAMQLTLAVPYTVVAFFVC